MFKADDEIDVKFLNPLHSNTAFFAENVRIFCRKFLIFEAKNSTTDLIYT